MFAYVAVITIIVLGLFVVMQGKLQIPTKPSPQPIIQPAASNISSSAKGVVIVKTPLKQEEIKSPLTVTGFVYSNNGILTIKLKQKESNQYVTEDKIVKISGKSDQISFAETLQFGLPAMPQVGVLEIEYKDQSNKGLDDKVTIEVNFPSDLGSGR